MKLVWIFHGRSCGVRVPFLHIVCKLIDWRDILTKKIVIIHFLTVSLSKFFLCQPFNSLILKRVWFSWLEMQKRKAGDAEIIRKFREDVATICIFAPVLSPFSRVISNKKLRLWHKALSSLNSAGPDCLLDKYKFLLSPKI